MDTTSMRVLDQRTSEVVRNVAATRHAMAITGTGDPMGVRLVPVERGPEIPDRLGAAGRATAPTAQGPITAPAEHDATVGVAAALTTDRDEERWWSPWTRRAVVKLCHRESATTEPVASPS